MRLSRLELSEIIRAKTGWNKAQARTMINMVFDAFTDALACGDSIRIRGLGTFAVKREFCKKGRMMPVVFGPIHLRKGKKSDRMPPRWIAVVRFKMSKTMKKRVRALIPKTSPTGGHS